jgi:hypothetical protein
VINVVKLTKYSLNIDLNKKIFENKLFFFSQKKDENTKKTFSLNEFNEKILHLLSQINSDNDKTVQNNMEKNFVCINQMKLAVLNFLNSIIQSEYGMQQIYLNSDLYK